jgi:homospermidine synthase
LNNATSLQVVSSIIGGIKWMIDHPRAGVVESEEIDHAALFDFVSHYWAPIQRRYTQWRPDPARHALAFDEFRLDGTLTQVLSAHESGSLHCV